MKVESGHAMWEMPVGMVRDEEDRIQKIADRQVQSAIQGVFSKFREPWQRTADDLVVSRRKNSPSRSGARNARATS